MALSHASVHLRPDDKPTVSVLPNTQSLALWLTDYGQGPTIMGSREELLEVRRAIGRFLFPEEFEQPDQVTAALVAALKPFADLGVGRGPDDEHDSQPYRLTRGAIRAARAAISQAEAI